MADFKIFQNVFVSLQTVGLVVSLSLFCGASLINIAIGFVAFIELGTMIVGLRRYKSAVFVCRGCIRKVFARHDAC